MNIEQKLLRLINQIEGDKSERLLDRALVIGELKSILPDGRIVYLCDDCAERHSGAKLWHNSPRHHPLCECGKDSYCSAIRSIDPEYAAFLKEPVAISPEDEAALRRYCFGCADCRPTKEGVTINIIGGDGKLFCQITAPRQNAEAIRSLFSANGYGLMPSKFEDHRKGAK